MPQVLESFDFPTRGSGRNNKYDYETFFSGTIYKMVPGEDFDVSPQQFASRMYSAARVRGLRCKCSVQDDGAVVIQAFHWDAETPADQPCPPRPEEDAASNTDVSADASAA